MSDVRTVFGITGWGRGRRLPTALAVAGFSGHQLAEVLVPVAVGVVIDRAIAGRDPVALGWSLAFLVLVFAVLIGSWQTGDRLGTRVYARGEHDLRQRVLTGALRRRSDRSAGDLLALSAGDASSTAGIVWVIAEQAAAATAVLVAGVVLSTVAWPLAVAVLVGTLAQATVVHAVSGGLRRRSYQAQQRAAHLDELSTDLAGGLRVLSALGGTDRAVQRYVERSADAAEAGYAAERAAAGLTAVNLVASALVFTGVAALGGWLTQSGQVSLGGFVTAMGLAQTLRGPLQTLGGLPAELAAKYGSARRLAEFRVDEEARTHTAPPSGGALRLVHRGRALDLAPGLTTGLRCDPDTAADLAALLGARRDPEAGELTVDGLVPDADRLRALVHAPPHDAAVFTGTVADNLPHPIIARHLTTSGFDEVLTRLPDGLAERVGERGLRLSGGQRQRLLLARALHQPQSTLVLHEPTTALDPITEAQVAAGLRRETRTLVLLTDRPALLAVCDRVHDLRAPEDGPC